MKILFIADVSLKDPASGAEVVLNQQATSLARSGHEIYAITRKADLDDIVVRNVNGVKEGCYVASPQRAFRALISLWRYPGRFYRDFNLHKPFQAIVVHQPFTYLPLLARNKTHRIPKVYVFHSPGHEEYLLDHTQERPLTRRLNVLLRRAAERVCVRKADKIMVLSKFMAQKLGDTHGVGEERIELNPGGVDLDRFAPPRDRASLKRALGLPEGWTHLLTVRNLETRMGLDNLLKCMDLLRKRRANIHLTLAGEGPEGEALARLIGTLELADHVSMVGFIPQERLSMYYGASDFFVLSTRTLEGFGLVTLESLACGTPVLGTPVGGTVEILSGLDPTFLFKDVSPEIMAEGIERAVVEYPVGGEEYEALRMRCSQYAARDYSWLRHMDQFQAILEELLEK